MTWRDEHGAEDLLRRAYGEQELEDGGKSLAVQVLSAAGAQREQHQRHLEQLAAERSQLEEAAVLVGEQMQEVKRQRRESQRDRRDAEEACSALSRHRFILFCYACALLIWTTYCEFRSNWPSVVVGTFTILGGWAVFYVYYGRHWLQEDR